jgi:hypothetical protein
MGSSESEACEWAPDRVLPVRAAEIFVAAFCVIIAVSSIGAALPDELLVVAMFAA